MASLGDEAVEYTAGIFRDMGIDALGSKIIATLFFEPKEMSMEDISKKTGYSLASISNKMRYLELWMEKRKKPGSKKAYYYLEKDIFKMHKRKMEVASQKQKEIMEAIGRFMEKYKGKKISGEDREKMRIIENYHKQLVEFEGMIEHFKCDLEKRIKG